MTLPWHNPVLLAEQAARLEGVSKVLHADAESLGHGLAENLAAAEIALSADELAIIGAVGA